MIAVDTNVLVYAHRSESPLHDVARRRLDALAASPEPWGLPIVCVWGFLRLVTQQIFDPPTPHKQALDSLDRLLGSPSVQVLSPGARHQVLLRQVVLEAAARGRLVTDAVIVALCREHGVDTVLSDDRDFLRFPWVRLEVLAG